MKLRSLALLTSSTPLRYLLAAVALTPALSLAGCAAEPESGGDVDGAEQALVGEACNGLDDDGDFSIDEDGACTTTKLVYDNHEYLLLDDSLDQATALAACRGRGFELVRIGGAAENAWLNSVSSSDGRWIDLNDRRPEGTWLLEDGSPAPYLNWSTYEPNGGTGENCGMMWSGGMWNDLHCGWTNQAFCELQDPVTWVNPVNVTTLATQLTRNAGSGWSAGASSAQSITAGDGFLQFSTNEANTKKMIGLSNGDANQSYTEIDYAVYLNSNGNLDIYENNSHKGTFGSYLAGDVFRVEVVGGQVRYLRNGAVFYTSTNAPVYPLVADTSLYHAGATLTDVRLKACASGTPGCNVLGMWNKPAGVHAQGTSLTRVPGSGWSAGASTYASITSGDGYAEFSTNEANTKKMAGLSNGDASQGYTEIDYAVYLNGNGNVEIYENGSHKGAFGSYLTGDVFRVEVLNGQVRYLKNSVPFYTSATAPVYPLVLDTSLYHGGATITAASIVSCAAGDTSCIDPGMWKTPVAVFADGDTLTRVPGSGWSAGASTYASIASGDGYAEFSTNEANTQKMAGLSNGDASQSYTEIDYAVYLNDDGNVEIYENGAGKGNFGSYLAGDVFRVEVLNGQVRYLKNGVPFYTSATAPVYPLVLDTSLYHGGATITAASVVSCASGDTSCIDPGMWSTPVAVFADGNTLTRVPGSGWSTGASTYASITSGVGYAEFSTNEANKAKMAGLSNGDASQSYTEIDYAVYLNDDGNVEIYENGAGKGNFGSYLAGDVFRVEVLNGQVRYLKNSVPFYTSATAPVYPLVLDTSLYHGGATITNASLNAL